MRRYAKIAYELVSNTISGYSNDRVARLSASLAYYTLFSLAPLLVIIIAIAGLVFGEQAARGQIVGEIGNLVGRQGAEAVQSLIQAAHRPGAGVVATVAGVVTLLIGATGVFGELQDALNTIWGVVPRPGQGVKGLLKVRAMSFVIILGVGFLLLVSLVLSAGLAALGKYLAGMLPLHATLMQFLSFLLSLLAFTMLLALIYKVLPDVELRWPDVWIGSVLTALMFSIGKMLIGLYLGRTSVASAYGAAGSVVLILLWVYYSATILYTGAEFTQVFVSRFGGGIAPSKHALKISDIVTVHGAGQPGSDDETKARAAKMAAYRHASGITEKTSGRPRPAWREARPGLRPERRARGGGRG
jgi:membrane protein